MSQKAVDTGPGNSKERTVWKGRKRWGERASRDLSLRAFPLHGTKGQIKLPLLLLPHYAGFSETHMALQKRAFYTSIIMSVVLVWRALAEALVETGLEGITALVQGLL